MLRVLINKVINDVARKNVRGFSILTARKLVDVKPCESSIERRPWLRVESNLLNSIRSKKKKAIKKHTDVDSDSEDEEQDIDDADDDDVTTSTVVNVAVPSTRLENILKAVFGVSRRRAEEAFFENKIRLNGDFLKKKTVRVEVHDEIDLQVGKSTKNSGMLIVHRAKVLDIIMKDDKIFLKIAKDKNLLIEDYPL